MGSGGADASEGGSSEGRATCLDFEDWHERLTDERIGEILDEIESSDDMDAVTSANIRLARRLLTEQRIAYRVR